MSRGMALLAAPSDPKDPDYYPFPKFPKQQGSTKEPTLAERPSSPDHHTGPFRVAAAAAWRGAARKSYRTQPFEARGAQHRAHRQVRSSLLFVPKFTVRRANSRQPL